MSRTYPAVGYTALPVLKKGFRSAESLTDKGIAGFCRSRGTVRATVGFSNGVLHSGRRRPVESGHRRMWAYATGSGNADSYQARSCECRAITHSCFR